MSTLVMPCQGEAFRTCVLEIHLPSVSQLCCSLLKMPGALRWWKRVGGTADQLLGCTLSPASPGCKTGSLLLWGRLWLPQSHPAAPPRGGVRTAHTPFWGLTSVQRDGSLAVGLDSARAWWGFRPCSCNCYFLHFLPEMCMECQRRHWLKKKIPLALLGRPLLDRDVRRPGWLRFRREGNLIWPLSPQSQLDCRGSGWISAPACLLGRCLCAKQKLHNQMSHLGH